jgi:hypothetical protein
MRYKEVFGERGDEAISLLGYCSRHSAVLLPERGKDQQAVFLHRSAPFHRQSHPFDAAGRAHDHRLRTTQQQVQALFLHGCMKAPDHWDTGSAQGLGKIVGA